VGFILVLGLAIPFLLKAVLGESEEGLTEPSVATPTGEYRVTFEITGSAERVELTLEGGEETEQGEYQIPFSQEVSVDSGDFVYISAQNLGTTGTVTCTIYVDGELLATTTAQGSYVVVSCSGIAGSD
jgi:hypothetical protein